MALRTISAAGGNFGSASTWVEGAVPTSADYIVGSASSGNLIVNANTTYTVQYVDFTDYTGTISFSQSSTNNSLIQFGSNGFTSIFGASMSFSTTGNKSRLGFCVGVFGTNTAGVTTYSLTQYGSVRLPNLSCFGLSSGARTITLNTNIYCQRLQLGGGFGNIFVVINGNTLFVNEQYTMTDSFFTGQNGVPSESYIGGTSIIRFDGPVRFNRGPKCGNDELGSVVTNPPASNGQWIVDANDTLFYIPTLTAFGTKDVTGSNSADFGIVVGTNSTILQGTISMTSSIFPYIWLPPRQNTTFNCLTNQPLNFFIQKDDTTTYTYDLNVPKIGTLLYSNRREQNIGTTAATSIIIRSNVNTNINRIKFEGSKGIIYPRSISTTGIAVSQTTNGPSYLHTPQEIQFSSTGTFSVGDIISIGMSDFAYPTTGFYNNGATTYTLNSSYNLMNSIRSNVAGTRTRLSLTSGTSSVIMWTNFRDIDASGGVEIKSFLPSQIANSLNVSSISSMSGGVSGGGGAFTFVN